MALCDDCIAQTWCGNPYVEFCLGYIKKLPCKWETTQTVVSGGTKSKTVKLERLKEKKE